MTVGPKVAIGLTGVALLVGGAALWAMFGSMIYFDVLAASFIGCFQ